MSSFKYLKKKLKLDMIDYKFKTENTETVENIGWNNLLWNQNKLIGRLQYDPS